MTELSTRHDVENTVWTCCGPGQPDFYLRSDPVSCPEGADICSFYSHFAHWSVSRLQLNQCVREESLPLIGNTRTELKERQTLKVMFVFLHESTSRHRK